MLQPLKPISPIKPPQSKAPSPVAAIKYSANGIPYRVSKNDGKHFELYAVAFAKFDCATGLCDRYVGLRMYDTPPVYDTPADLERLMLDCSSILRHGKEWAARPMFGPNGFYYGATPLEAAQKAVDACKK